VGNLVNPAKAIALLALALTMPAGAQDHQEETPSSKTEAMQIRAEDAQAELGSKRGGAFLDDGSAPRPAADPLQVQSNQISRPGTARQSASQITGPGESGPRMAQLSKAELDATLAQLTPAERSVLLQAIVGTDICDNPPNVPAVIALCQTRIETRSSEFATAPEVPLSAEERLLRVDSETAGFPSLEAVIVRLSRVNSASSNDFSNQAIASVALAQPPAPEQPDKGEDPTGLGLGAQTDAVINAIVEQLGGQGGGNP
jgi:hypothetical protein